MKNFIQLDSYPQASLNCEDVWSKPIIGGVGCNLFLGRKGNLPPFSNTKHWQKIREYLIDLKMGMIRVGFLPNSAPDCAEVALRISPFNEETKTFDWDHDYFKIVKWLDDLSDELNFPIMIDPWWVPECYMVKSEVTRGAPVDSEVYANEFIVPFVNHIINTLKCKHVTYLGLLNEPIWHKDDRDLTNFAVPEGEDQLVWLTRMYESVRKALDTNGFNDIDVLGPSALCNYQFPPADFLASGVNPIPYLGAMDHHYYLYYNDSVPNHVEDFFSSHEMIDGSVRRWTDFCKRINKPFMITEMGSFAYGRLFWGEKDMTGPSTHTCAISDAQFILRSLAYGTQAFLRWTFSVPEHYDGKWSLVEWDEEGVHKSTHIYPAYKLLMNVIRPGTQYKRVHIGISAGQVQSIFAIALKTEGREHILIMNTKPGINSDIIFGQGPWVGKTFERTVVDEVRKLENLPPISFKHTEGQGTDMMLTPYSITLLSEITN